MEETTLIDDVVPLKSEAKSFLIANGINHADSPIRMSDIEMVTIQSLSYISLKDLLPVSPPLITSPTHYNRRESLREIPIKDPLVQHAAWAYLQPMSTAARQGDGQSWKEKCGGGGWWLFGCFGGFFNDVVWKTVKRLVLVSEKNDNIEDEDEDEDEDGEEEEEEDDDDHHHRTVERET
ncbi:hypothetical protein ACSBR2_003581 [Camellia fascicularis]